MSTDPAVVIRRAVVELVNLPSCAAGCYNPLATSPNSYSCDTVSNSKSLESCLTDSCSLPESIFARNATEIACGTPARDDSTPFLIINIVLGVLTATFVTLRLGYRVFFSRRHGRLDVDDGLILAASPIAIASLAVLLAGLWKHGIGRDIWVLSSEEVVTFGVFLYTMEILYLGLLTLIKLTLSVFYLEVFPSPTIRKLLWATVVFHTALGISFVFKAAFQCDPINYSWLRYDSGNASNVHGHCISINGSGWANAAINVASDFWLIGIPLTQLHRLRLHWKKKIGASFMFMTGLLVTVISFLRLNTLRTYANTTNPTFDQYGVILWSAVEVNIGLICTCLPSIRLILLRIWPRVFGTTSHASDQRPSQPPAKREISGYSYKSSVNAHDHELDHELDAAAILAEPSNALCNSATRSTYSGDADGQSVEDTRLSHEDVPRVKV
ncbi:integral membrane protein [Metarhizium rileyi]|uniref:Integral membrane protein n=1 Tax=Metarhizium rileyi (strain RCEF 4871) TaxID=1649241 RepID=A0A167CYC6_METRR|nr:integral membrane protein [Metarhizium rileyi RCEF 4871]